MSMDIVQKVIEDSSDLYSLPQTLVEVLNVIKDENSSAQDLANVLRKDPPMAAKLLRIVNSPYYGVGRKIGSVSQAVVTLGLRQVTALALSTSVYAMTEKWDSAINRVRFWRHSLEVAIASRTIAEKIGYRRIEEIFVAGLLHDLGMLVMENSFPKEFAQIWRRLPKHESLVELEETTWGTNHARVGQFLLEQWRLPEEICRAVGGHHAVFTAGADDEDLRPVQIVSLANLISQFPIVEHQVTPTTHGTENREIIRENLGLSAETLMSIEKHLFSQTISESKYLDMDIGSTEEILVEANRLLFGQYAAVESLLDENRKMQRQAAGDRVKRGFLESFKTTTTTLSDYLLQASSSILGRAREVLEGVESGAIQDPGGLVVASVEAIMTDAENLATLINEVRGLSETETALYYDQQPVHQVQERIRKELEQLETV